MSSTSRATGYPATSNRKGNADESLAAGLARPIEGRRKSRNSLLDDLHDNPEWQNQAMGAVYRASATIDAKYGTNLVGAFLTNLANGNFVSIP
jgi:hypothetical protein